jgi:hypothetical protein
VFADAGIEAHRLDELTAEGGESVVGDALTRVASPLTIYKLICEIEHSLKRISDLVQTVNEFSYMGSRRWLGMMSVFSMPW